MRMRQEHQDVSLHSEKEGAMETSKGLRKRSSWISYKYKRDDKETSSRFTSPD